MFNMVKDNMMAMDIRSYAYGQDRNSANQMNMLTRARYKNKPLSIKTRMKLINTWDNYTPKKT
jgi:hypothetical protein